VEIKNLSLSDSSNEGYCLLAVNGNSKKAGLLPQWKNGIDTNVNVVSGATCSSRAFMNMMEAVKQKLKEQSTE